MKNKLRFIIPCSSLIFALIFGNSFYINSSSASSPEDPPPPAHVGICLDEKNVYTSYVVKGYKDALAEHFGDHVIYAQQSLSETPSAAMAAESLILAGSDLIFTYGEKSLDAAASLTETTPIFFSGVADYRNALHLLPSRDRRTGRNASGLTGLSPASEGLSLLIEAADHHPKAVGIFYDPTDSASIYQNELFERMLNEAGIPWKEYEVISDDAGAESLARDGLKPSTPTIPLPTITAAASGKEGPNIHPDSIGDNGDLTGINEPSSARSAKRSELWKKGRGRDTGSFEEVLPVAVEECDVLYLCAENAVVAEDAHAALLKEACVQKDVATVGGGISVGGCSLTCLCVNPYELGYRCGDLSAKVLEGNEEISELEVGSVSSIESAKLFNQELSDAMNRSWPKSFCEIKSYFDDFGK